MLTLAGLGVLVWIGWLAVRVADSSSPSFGEVHVYQVIDTRVGRATIGCGGALTSSCERDAGIFFDNCDARYERYFRDARLGTIDTLVRGLLGREPPWGGRWISALCGNPD